jgi:LysR family nitrogen assimilation transcriptional regulator
MLAALHHGSGTSVMDLRQLEFFVRVAELGSMTKAAAALGVAQPLLSREIRELEADLGVRLLARNGRGVTVTEPGERFLARARVITADVETARDEARALRGRPAGPVSVAMAPSAGALLWAPLVTRIQDSYPEVRLKVFEGYSGDVIEWLVAGKVDIGVLYQPHLATSLKPEFLIEERLYLIAPPGDFPKPQSSIEFRQLGTLPLILPGKNHAIRRLLDQAAAKHRITIGVRLEVNAYPTIKTLVMSGRGCTVLPVAPVLPEVHAGQLAIVEIVDPVLTQTVGLVTSSHHQASVGARAVRQIIQTLVEEFVNSGRWPARYGRQDAASADAA